MADPVVHITNGIPDLGTGNITTLGQTIAAQAQAISGQFGPLAQGSVTTASPVYTAGTINPLSLDGSGNLRTLISNASLTVSGTVTANQGGSWSMNVSQFGGNPVVTGTGISGVGVPRVTVASDSSLAATQSGTWNINNISGTVSLPTGAATSAKQPALGTAGAPSADVITVQGIASGVAQPVSIAAAVTVAQATAANLNATVTGTVAVSGVASVKPDGTVWTLTGSSANVQVSGGSVAATQSGNWTSRVVGNVGGVLDAAQNAAAPANALVVGGIYNSTQPTITTGNACQLQTDANGNLRVNIMAGAGSGGTASTVGGAVPGQGTLALGSVTTAAPSYTTATANSLSLTTAGALRVDGSAVTQPVSGTVSVSGSVAVTGTFWQATQPISATSLPLPTGAATNVALGSATSGAGGTTALGAVTTGLPSYTTAQSNALSLTTNGLLRVDASNTTVPVSGTFWQATQPVSGTVTVTQGTAANLNATVTGTVTANLGTIAGVATSANQPTNVTQGTSTTSQTGILSFGAVTTGSPTYTTGQSNPLSLDTAGNLRVNVVAGGASGGTSSGVGSATPSTGTLAMGAVTTGAPTYTTATANSLSLTTAGALRVDGSAVTQPVSGTFWQATQPVSGTVTANQGGTWTVQPGNTANTTAWLVTGTGGTFPVTGTFWQATQPISAASLPLPSGAATAANQTNVQGVIGNATAPASMSVIGGVFNTTKPTLTTGQSAAIQVNSSGIQLVDGSAVTQPVSGTVTVNQGTAGSAWPVTLTSTTITGTVAATQSGTWTVQQGTPPWLVGGDIANAATDGGNPVKIGGVATTSIPTAVTNGQRVNAQFDKNGKQIIAGAVRTQKGVQKTSITTATETSVTPTAGASNFLDVYSIVVTNKSATSVFVDFRDATAGSIRMTLAAPAGDTRGFTVPVDSAMVMNAQNNNWTATVSSAVSSIEITMLYVINN